MHFYFQPGELDASWNGHRQATVPWATMSRYHDPQGLARLVGVQFHKLPKAVAPPRTTEPAKPPARDARLRPQWGGL
ncbi:MAG TPA: hypothetical protein PK640_14880 [Verrucomicrobiota bacterium]|nr:hypothetical protein [Verrucomicrobiota bacterium]